MINKQSLQDRIKKHSKDRNIPANTILQTYFYDAFLKRLSRSQYANNFVLKGGFLLAASLGLELRSTIDMDFLLRQKTLTRENIIRIFQEIIAIDVDDNITFEFIGIDEIRKEDEYGGFSISFISHLENIKVPLSFDIATGDPITPEAITYHYKCVFTHEELKLPSYNFETILSEKLETVLRRGTNNSRCKDFYDIYIIQKLRWNDIETSTLRNAFRNTCLHRKYLATKEEAKSIVTNLSSSSIMKNRWSAYQRKNTFAREIKYEDTIASINTVIETIF